MIWSMIRVGTSIGKATSFEVRDLFVAQTLSELIKQSRFTTACLSNHTNDLPLTCFGLGTADFGGFWSDWDDFARVEEP